MYSTEIASFLGTMQKISVDEYMLYSVVLLQGCGLIYKVVMWRLGCKRNGNRKKVTSSNDDVEKQLDGLRPQLDRIVVVQPVETKKVPLGRGHSITMEREEEDKATAH